ncbi:TRAP transporter large permease [Rhodoferax sp.]|uniref:TRAP transporter large permease n=1 Tax=Rhodoferax sp. TaxID=50421 RepID=UPI0027308832|nr:TRAP transporter large permease [Rhodoferax sp.]MDP1531026.1 TRAP transporter large permease [Rhodoferax sp.]MDP1945043.1 TRAP transporter large permease [Rhodoferax sp.]MDP2442353.1 TRAP transporter large permease [Rhodoferax sp.]MDP3193083.1 TRAP transporter large permease [Rhodoferax sp.]MDP3336857.1 TRAP transporter large permease [Rhodoferax sp.]
MGPSEVAIILFGVFALMVVLRVPVAFALGLACIPVFFIDDRLTPFLLLNEMLKSYNSFLLLSIPFFMLAANLMNAAGITDKLINLSRALVGWLPGGLGHVSVLVSMLFAGISGSSTAEAAGVGGVLIPAMKKQGYDTPFAVSLIACAAVMGVIIPPSILMVVWGGVISVSIGGLFLAGVLPGLLMGLSFMLVVYIYAKRRNYPVYPKPTGKELRSAAVSAILPILTPGIIVGGIVGGFFTPTEASVVAVLYAMFLGVFIYRRLGLTHLRETMYDSGRFAAISLFCIGTASAFGWLLAYFRIPQLFVDMVSGWGGGVTSVGFLTALCFLVIGCFIDAIPAIIIVGTILAPLAADVGMHPIHFAIIGVISIAYGLVTPPYGLCLMIACTVGGIKIKEAVRDTLILFIPMVAVLVFVILVPEALLWLPRTLMPTLIK